MNVSLSRAYVIAREWRDLSITLVGFGRVPSLLPTSMVAPRLCVSQSFKALLCPSERSLLRSSPRQQLTRPYSSSRTASHSFLFSSSRISLPSSSRSSPPLRIPCPHQSRTLYSSPTLSSQITVQPSQYDEIVSLARGRSEEFEKLQSLVCPLNADPSTLLVVRMLTNHDAVFVVGVSAG
jgi:hypothetical protein